MSCTAFIFENCGTHPNSHQSPSPRWCRIVVSQTFENYPVQISKYVGGGTNVTLIGLGEDTLKKLCCAASTGLACPTERARPFKSTTDLYTSFVCKASKDQEKTTRKRKSAAFSLAADRRFLMKINRQARRIEPGSPDSRLFESSRRIHRGCRWSVRHAFL